MDGKQKNRHHKQRQRDAMREGERNKENREEGKRNRKHILTAEIGNRKGKRKENELKIRN